MASDATGGALSVDDHDIHAAGPSRNHLPPRVAGRKHLSGPMHGFQLWGNLPSSLKMTPPRYREVKAVDIPEVTDDDGTRVRIVAGNFWGNNPLLSKNVYGEQCGIIVGKRKPKSAGTARAWRPRPRVRRENPN